MAKKKTIDLRSVEPTPVPAGDVNIIYNGTRIAGFSEDTEAVLKTAGCRVEQDINVNYTKPAGAALCEMTILNQTGGSVPYVVINSNISYGTETIALLVSPDLEFDQAETHIQIIPSYDVQDQEYSYSLTIPSETDQYTITATIGGAEYSLSEKVYHIGYAGAAYPESVTITITAKQV